jgi:DNA-binding MarR family transcriptional regulator
MPGKNAPEQCCVCSTLRKATRAVTQYFDKMLRPSGLRSTQFNILAELRGRGGATITELTKVLVIDQTTLTRSLALLKRKGLLKFAPKPDGRMKSVQLTKKGLSAFKKAQPLWAAAQKKVLSGMNREHWETLRAELDRLAHEPNAEA